MHKIRFATLADAAAIAKVSVDTWQSAYVGIVPAEFLASLSYTERAERLRHRFEHATAEDGFFLVTENAQGEVVGFASGGEERSGTRPTCGELYTLYVLPTYQQQGFGRQLMVAGMQQLSEMGFTNMAIWTLAANPSRSFYERLDGIAVAQRDTEIAGVSLSEMCYLWETLKT